MKEGAIPYRWIVAVTLLIACSTQYLDRVGITILHRACAIRTREKPVAGSVEASHA